jgi:iron complex outermembrane recepter protein
VNYDNHYRDIASVPNRAVNSWTTMDLQLSYSTRADARDWLGDMRFTLSAQNVFNTLPPFLNNAVGVGYDQENADLSGRTVSLDVRKQW